MTCREFVDFVLDYLAGDLPPAERVRFEAHLRDCPDCVAYLHTYAQTPRLAKAALCGPDDALPEDVPPTLVAAIVAARDRGS
jgi:anti-sigma factor RsiW